MWICCGKPFALKLLALEFVYAPGTSALCPVDSRAVPTELLDYKSHLQTGRILAHCSDGSKRKVREGMSERSHCINNFSTSTRNVQVGAKTNQLPMISTISCFEK